MRRYAIGVSVTNREKGVRGRGHPWWSTGLTPWRTIQDPHGWRAESRSDCSSRSHNGLTSIRLARQRLAGGGAVATLGWLGLALFVAGLCLAGVGVVAPTKAEPIISVAMVVCFVAGALALLVGLSMLVLHQTR
jgi:hypothetical protein